MQIPFPTRGFVVIVGGFLNRHIREMDKTVGNVRWIVTVPDVGETRKAVAIEVTDLIKITQDIA